MLKVYPVTSWNESLWRVWRRCLCHAFSTHLHKLTFLTGYWLHFLTYHGGSFFFNLLLVTRGLNKLKILRIKPPLHVKLFWLFLVFFLFSILLLTNKIHDIIIKKRKRNKNPKRVNVKDGVKLGFDTHGIIYFIIWYLFI